MSDDNFETIMKEHSDEKLIDVLKKRDGYQEEAIDSAIKEAIKRKLIIDSNELDVKFPIKDEKKEKIKKELGLFGKKIDFQKNKNFLYLIGIGTGLFGILFLGAVPIVPIIYIGLVYYCSKYYKHNLANVIIWIASFQIVAVILYIFSLLMEIFI